MPGKPFQSKLDEYHDEIRQWRANKLSYRKISDRLNEMYQLNVTHNAVYSYVTAKSRQNVFRKRFFDGLDQDLRDGLMQQIIAIWTHDSTAIEGNSLTLGETNQILQFGLTINGKPLKDHEEVYGHAKAIELIERITDNGLIREVDLFALHQAVMPQSAFDIHKPIGDWKKEYNGTMGVVDEKAVYKTYANPLHVPTLMSVWFKEFNHQLNNVDDFESACELYSWSHLSFVRIHPFFDGNGRLARLLANIPMLLAGYPPIVISNEKRSEYIQLLWNYQLTLDELIPGLDMVPTNKHSKAFFKFIKEEYKAIDILLNEAWQEQEKRK